MRRKWRGGLRKGKGIGGHLGRGTLPGLKLPVQEDAEQQNCDGADDAEHENDTGLTRGKVLALGEHVQLGVEGRHSCNSDVLFS